MKINLTDRLIKSLKPKDKQYKVWDSLVKGLYLIVYQNGTKTWKFKYRVNHKEQTLTFMQYQFMTLAQARESCIQAKKDVDNGIDVAKEKQKAKYKHTEDKLNTIKDLCSYWLETYKIEYPTKAKESLQRFEKYLYPYFKQRPLETIKLKDLEDFLFGLVEQYDIYDTVKRIKQNLTQAYSKALKHELVKTNIAREIGVLPTKPIKHFPAITDVSRVDEFGEVIYKLYNNKEDIIISTAIKLLPHLMARPSELRSMQWKDIDFTHATWDYTMNKVKQEKRVPLSKQVINLLSNLYKYTKYSDYVFPANTQTKYINKSHVSKAIKKCGIDTNVQSVHGFRASATTFLHEILKMKDDWIELQLGHKIGNEVKISYKRTLFLNERVDMMKEWSNWLDSLRLKVEDNRFVKGKERPRLIATDNSKGIGGVRAR